MKYWSLFFLNIEYKAINSIQKHSHVLYTKVPTERLEEQGHAESRGWNPAIVNKNHKTFSKCSFV